MTNRKSSIFNILCLLTHAAVSLACFGCAFDEACSLSTYPWRMFEGVAGAVVLAANTLVSGLDGIDCLLDKLAHRVDAFVRVVYTFAFTVDTLG